MKGKGIDAVVFLGIGILFLITAWHMSGLLRGSNLDKFCSVLPIIAGIGTIVENLRTDECYFTRLQRLAMLPILAGILYFLSIIFLLNQNIFPISRKSFFEGNDVIVGVMVIIIGGIAVWFVFSPPNIGKSSAKVKEDNTLSITNSYRPSYLTKSEQEAPGGNILDQTLSDIMNADTNLSSLMNANPDLAGKIQQTFDYYDPNAGVFRAWARRLRGEGRGKLLEVLNKEQQLLIEQAALFEKNVIDGTKKQVEFKLFLAQNVMQLLALKSQAKLNEQAFGKGMFVEAFSDVNKEKELSQIRLKEQEAKSNLEEMREEARIKRNLDSAKQYKMQEDDITDDLRRRMEKALLELDAIEARTDLSERSKAALAIAKQNEIDNFSRRIIAREKKAQSDEESFL